MAVFIHRRLNDDGTPVGPIKLNTLPSDSVEYDDDEGVKTQSQQVRVGVVLLRFVSI
jgi:hypothetical protein